MFYLMSMLSFSSPHSLSIIWLLKGCFAGHRSVLRTFISAFIASYEINSQVLMSLLLVCDGKMVYVLLLLILISPARSWKTALSI